jgi:hypothetical protein
MGPTDALGVEPMGNGPGTAPAGVLGEDPPHDRRLARLDAAQATLRQAIAIKRTRCYGRYLFSVTSEF